MALVCGTMKRGLACIGIGCMHICTGLQQKAHSVDKCIVCERLHIGKRKK